MSEKLTVGELVYKISGDMDNLKTEVKRADTEIKKLKDTIEKNNKVTTQMSKGFAAAKTAVVGFISGALVRGIYNLARSGAELDALSQSFNKLAGNIGLQTDDILNSLRKYSGGTVANKDLILSANRAITLGVAKDMDEFGVLMQTARIRAQDMGLSVTQAFDNIVTGIGRGSPLILDNLGFVVSATQATEDYAKELGIAAEQLTEQQKKEALKASILRQGREEIEATGEVTATYADRLAQASTFVTNLKDNIGRALLPAMASLLDVTLDNSEGILDTTEKVNNLGRQFYRVGQVLIAVGKSVALGFRTLLSGVQSFFLVTLEAANAVLKGVRKVKEALDLDTTAISSKIDSINTEITNLQTEMSKNADKMEDSSEDIFKAIGQAFDPSEYQGLSEGQMSQIIQDTGASLSDTGAAAGEAKEEVEDFTDKLLDLRDEAVKTREELENKLNETFEDFGKNIKDNIEESVSSLAQIVLEAEQAKKNIKDALKDEDLTSEQRRDLKKQLKEQEAILKERRDFEERQAEQIAGIRAQLEEAGIDAAKAGLDGLLDVRSLEEEIEEERRLAGLNEFQRFEELQNKKLQTLVDTFITEANLQKEKIAKQREYEEEITTFLNNEDDKRLANTQEWAADTLREYGKLASSLRSLISQQQRLNALRAEAGLSSSRSNPSRSSSSRSTTNNYNRTVNAPISISGGRASSSRNLARDIAWELGRK